MAAGNRRWTVSSRRFTVSVALAVIGSFVFSGGIGMANFDVAAIGLAVIAAGIGLYAGSAVASRQYAYVAGNAHVQTASLPPSSARSGRCNLLVIITAPNIDAVPVRVRDPRVPVAKWPETGMDLPALVAVNDPRRVRIMWDAVPAHGLGRSRPPRPRPGDEILDIPPRRTSTADADAWDDPDFDDASLDEIDIVDATGRRTTIEFDLPGLRLSTGVPPHPRSGADDVIDVEYFESDDDAGPNPVPFDTATTQPIVPLTESTAAAAEPLTAEPVMMTPSTPLPRRTPSPRPRMAEDPPGIATPSAAPEADETTTGGLHFQEAYLVEATNRDSDVPLFDQEAYVAAADPNDTNDAGWVRSAAVTLFVRDLSRSIVFYRDVLGFTEVDASRDGAMLISRDACIVLSRVDMPPVDRRTVQVMLAVPDVDAAYRHLRAANVTFVHKPRRVRQYEQVTLWAAQFRDPDGHHILVMEQRPID